MKHIFTFSLFCGLSSVTFGQTTVFSENFQTGLPANWTLLDVDQQTPNEVVSEYTSAWIITSNPDNATDSVISSTSYFEPEGQANKWLITPAINLGEYGNSLSWRARSFDPSYPDSYKVLVSTTNTDLTSFTDTVGLIQQEDAEWITRTANLSNAGFNDQTIYIAFVNNTNKGFKLFLDDIAVEVENPLSTVELTAENVSVFPNPAIDLVTISSSNQWDKADFYSLEGKLMSSESIENNQFSVSNLPTGMYFIQISNQNSQFTTRLLKK